MAAVATTGIVVKPSTRTYEAATGLVRGYVVTQGAADNLVALAGANAAGVGIVQETQPVIGAPVSVAVQGDAVAVIGAAVGAGQYVISNGAGQVVPSAAIGDQVIGRAISSGANAGDEIVILVNPFIR